jgi:N-formylglutamate amidohydrolase
MRQIEQAFVSAGFKVARNAPFAGAYITQHYGRPSRRQHVVQVEIDRALYMDEAAIRPLPEFASVKRRLTRAIADIADIGRPASVPLAAE